MAGIVSFNITVFTEGLERLPELAARLKDLTPALHNLIAEWAQSNEDKFRESRGTQVGGVQQDDSLFWHGLTEPYMKEKTRKGFEDWLMVRTGDLRRAMTDPEGFFSVVMPDKAVFGIPLDPEDAIKVTGTNWELRQAIFLNYKDRLAIKREVKNYFALGEKYREILFERGLAAAARRREHLQWDVEFNGRVNS